MLGGLLFAPIFIQLLAYYLSVKGDVRVRYKKYIIATTAFLILIAIPVCNKGSNQDSDVEKYKKFTNKLPNGLVDVAALNLPDQFHTHFPRYL